MDKEESIFQFIHRLGLRGLDATLAADAIEERDRQQRKIEREACRSLFESINPASDEERLTNTPGAGAMGAVLEYRDAIARRNDETP